MFLKNKVKFDFRQWYIHHYFKWFVATNQAALQWSLNKMRKWEVNIKKTTNTTNATKFLVYKINNETSTIK